MTTNPYQVVKDFEAALCEYTGAPYAVTVNSCTNAIFLALRYQFELEHIKFFNKTKEELVHTVEIPKHTYISVPMQIKHAGFNVKFRDEKWKGMYQLEPFDLWDSARFFTKDLFYYTTNNKNYDKPSACYDIMNKRYTCVSFHWSKTLGIQQGGAILHNDPDFDRWARMARFDGRTEGVPPNMDNFTMLGYHMYMSPEIAAEGLVRLKFLKDDNDPLPNDDYPDLSKLDIFK